MLRGGASGEHPCAALILDTACAQAQHGTRPKGHLHALAQAGAGATRCQPPHACAAPHVVRLGSEKRAAYVEDLLHVTSPYGWDAWVDNHSIDVTG